MKKEGIKPTLKNWHKWIRGIFDIPLKRAKLAEETQQAKVSKITFKLNETKISQADHYSERSPHIKTLQATSANARLFYYDPMKINNPRNLNDSLGLVA